MPPDGFFTRLAVFEALGARERPLLTGSVVVVPQRSTQPSPASVSFLLTVLPTTPTPCHSRPSPNYTLTPAGANVSLK